MSEIFAVFIPLIGSLIISVSLIIYSYVYQEKYPRGDYSTLHFFAFFFYILGVLFTTSLLYRYITGVGLL